jgi:hypothetical protein
MGCAVKHIPSSGRSETQRLGEKWRGPHIRSSKYDAQIELL